jgi:hypothetical protein
VATRTASGPSPPPPRRRIPRAHALRPDRGHRQPHGIPQNIRVEFKNVALSDKGTAWTIAVPDLQARNVPGGKMAATIEESPLAPRPGTLAAAPLSITLYRFQMR